MKQLITLITFILISICAHAQSDVTKFLGIPVDGSKKEMIKALKKKGFKQSKRDKAALEGVFNGNNVNVFVLETNNKVSRIAILPIYSSNASEVKILFNNLCSQFLQKDNYIAQANDIIVPKYKDISIPSDEDISYEMTINNKRYEASFIQLPAPMDSIMQGIEPLKHVTITISGKNDEPIDLHSYTEMVLKYSKNSVWFKIDEQYGKFFISLFYDNNYNRTAGEDL
jgi:hypothetical protein